MVEPVPVAQSPPSATTLLSHQTIRENTLLQLRIRRCGATYQEVADFLVDQATRSNKKLTHALLLSLANEMIATRGCPKLDRLAVRKKEGLICWFCEHAHELVSTVSAGRFPTTAQTGRHAALLAAKAQPPPPVSLAPPPVTVQPPEPKPEEPARPFLGWGNETTEDFLAWLAW
jgi:hypothetical protein